MNKEKREYRKHFFSGDASWHVPLVGGSSGFSNCDFLGVGRGTFSSGTVLSCTSVSLKILVNFKFLWILRHIYTHNSEKCND